MAANLSGHSLKGGGGGKSFYGELKEDGTFYVLATAERLPDAMAFHGVLSLLNFQILPTLSKELIVASATAPDLLFFQDRPQDFMTLIRKHVMEIHNSQFI